MRSLLAIICLCLASIAIAGNSPSSSSRPSYSSPSYSSRPSYSSPSYSKPSTPAPKPYSSPAYSSPSKPYSSPTFKPSAPVTTGPVLPRTTPNYSPGYSQPSTVVHHYDSGPGFWFWMWALDRPQHQQPIVVAASPGVTVAAQPSQLDRPGSDGPPWYVIAANIAIGLAAAAALGWFFWWGWNRFG